VYCTLFNIHQQGGAVAMKGQFFLFDSIHIYIVVTSHNQTINPEHSLRKDQRQVWFPLVSIPPYISCEGTTVDVYSN
jgi:hypothetical protein